MRSSISPGALANSSMAMHNKSINQDIKDVAQDSASPSGLATTRLAQKLLSVNYKDLKSGEFKVISEVLNPAGANREFRASRLEGHNNLKLTDTQFLLSHYIIRQKPYQADLPEQYKHDLIQKIYKIKQNQEARNQLKNSNYNGRLLMDLREVNTAGAALRNGQLAGSTPPNCYGRATARGSSKGVGGSFQHSGISAMPSLPTSTLSQTGFINEI